MLWCNYPKRPWGLFKLSMSNLFWEWCHEFCRIWWVDISFCFLKWNDRKASSALKDYRLSWRRSVDGLTRVCSCVCQVVLFFASYALCFHSLQCVLTQGEQQAYTLWASNAGLPRTVSNTPSEVSGGSSSCLTQSLYTNIHAVYSGPGNPYLFSIFNVLKSFFFFFSFHTKQRSEIIAFEGFIQAPLKEYEKNVMTTAMKTSSIRAFIDGLRTDRLFILLHSSSNLYLVSSLSHPKLVWY